MSCLGDCATTIDFCVNIESPQGFTFDQKNNFNVCVQSSSQGLCCSVVPCTFTQPVQVSNPCDGTTITCNGEITVNKVVVSGDVALLFNADVFAPAGDPGDCASILTAGGIINTPGTPSVPITVSRLITVPVCQSTCVTCAPISCPATLVSSVLLTSVTKITSDCGIGFDILSIRGTITFTSC